MRKGLLQKWFVSYRAIGGYRGLKVSDGPIPDEDSNSSIQYLVVFEARANRH